MNTEDHRLDLLHQLLKFNGIELFELNAKAALLKRLERKYVLENWQLEPLLEKLQGSHFILDIDDRRIHRYQSTYYDSPDLICFRAHNQGRHNRFKLRTRLYEDSGLKFFELKEKTRLAATAKSRIPITNTIEHYHEFGGLLPRIQAITGLKNDLSLSPVLNIRYGRITLFDPRDLTRVTIDIDLSFETLDTPALYRMSPRVIVEVKSAHRLSLTDRLLRKSDLKPQRKMSKYCIGATACGLWTSSSSFSSLTRRLMGAPAQRIPIPVVGRAFV